MCTGQSRDVRSISVQYSVRQEEQRHSPRVAPSTHDQEARTTQTWCWNVRMFSFFFRPFSHSYFSGDPSPTVFDTRITLLCAWCVGELKELRIICLETLGGTNKLVGFQSQSSCLDFEGWFGDCGFRTQWTQFETNRSAIGHRGNPSFAFETSFRHKRKKTTVSSDRHLMLRVYFSRTVQTVCWRSLREQPKTVFLFSVLHRSTKA